MTDQTLLAVDFGASGGKCFAGTFRNNQLAMQEVHRFAHEGVSFHVSDQKGCLRECTYWDDIMLYQNIIKGLQACRREIGPQLASLGIDTWGADGAFLAADGDMLGNMYCYRDHRLDDMIAQVKARMDPRRIYEITGIHFQPFNLSNQLLWFVTNRKHLLRAANVYLPVPALFSYYLCGAKKVDSAWASVTQLMDARTRQWSAELLAALEIPATLMPEIVEPGQVLGEIHAPIAESTGLNRAKVVAVGSHDTACAFASAPVANPAEALIISSGTWSLIGKLVPRPITSDAAMAANISNEGGIGNVRFLKNCMGTWLVQELRRAWRTADGKELSWAEMNSMTSAAPAFAAFIDPDDMSFYNPANMETAIRDFCRKTRQTPPADRGTFLRVVYESLAFKYRLVNDQICAASGSKTRAVHIVGGGCKNTLLNQFTADALGLPVLAGPEEATAVGNLMVQAVGMGILPCLADAMPLIKNSFPIREFAPSDIQTWNQAFERFRSIVK